MARFYVGQRVRIKWSLNWPELAGAAGTIESKEDAENFIVAVDAWGGSSWAPRKGDKDATIFGPCSDQLEPLNPPKQELGSWDALRDLGLNVDSIKRIAEVV